MSRTPYIYPRKEKNMKATSLPPKTHISYKEKGRDLLVCEEELMNHYCMNRSDLHKHLIRNAYIMLKMQQVGF